MQPPSSYSLSLGLWCAICIKYVTKRIRVYFENLQPNDA
jgi:hypothetical protein